MEWKDGYITEMEYVHGVYRELGPSALNFVMLLQSMEPIALRKGFTYCDLGCGQGESVNLFAACHPEGKFHGIDFNYAHIAGARGLAHQANLGNVTFWEASFEDLPDLDLPRFDFITLHGVYSWVGSENRDRIVTFLRDRLKPGGVVYVSYNSLPGWSTHAPLRELLYAYADTQPGPLEARVDRAIDFVDRLKVSGAGFFDANPSAKEFFDYIRTLPRNYVVHEFFNRDWTLFYHAEVVRHLTAARLTFVGSASIADNQELLRFSAPLQQEINGVGDRVMRETVKDFVSAPLLRRDVFSQGARKLTPELQRAHVGTSTFALVVPQARIERKAPFPIGEVLFEPALYDPILFALEEKPHSLDQLLERPEVAVLGEARVVEALTVLLAAEYAMPAVQPALASLIATSALNIAILQRELDNIDKQSLASPVLQNGIKVDWLERLLLICEIDGTADPLSFVWEKMEANHRMLTRNGEVLQSKEENTEELARVIELFARHKLPLLRQLGIV